MRSLKRVRLPPQSQTGRPFLAEGAAAIEQTAETRVATGALRKRQVSQEANNGMTVIGMSKVNLERQRKVEQLSVTVVSCQVSSDSA